MPLLNDIFIPLSKPQGSSDFAKPPLKLLQNPLRFIDPITQQAFW